MSPADRCSQREEDGIEIVGEECVVRLNGERTAPTSVAEFLRAVAPHLDPPPVRDVIPEGVRAIRSRGGATVIAVEEPPGVRAVRWLREDSPRPCGPGALYRTATLAFPFVILVFALRDGALTNVQQCFYRTTRLRTLDRGATLGVPVLPNVTPHPRLKLPCWLCLTKDDLRLGRLRSLDRRVARIRATFWGAAFNRSCGADSYWESLRSIDPRLGSPARWEEETQRDSLFPLGVQWPRVAEPLGRVMDDMLAAVASSPAPGSAGDLIRLLRPSHTGPP
jgi:hypothetical protein